MRNTIVLHFVGGKVRKGITEDFYPNKEQFHLVDKDNGEVAKIAVQNLKAIFFVKDFDGDPRYKECSDRERVGMGKRIKVSFRDGETLIGYTQGYSPLRGGFFVFPCDMNSNNDRIFVVTGSTLKVEFI
jgi:hypothetical protein